MWEGGVSITNAQAQAYAIMAVKNLIEDGVIKADISKTCWLLDRESSNCLMSLKKKPQKEKQSEYWKASNNSL